MPPVLLKVALVLALLPAINAARTEPVRAVARRSLAWVFVAALALRLGMEGLRLFHTGLWRTALEWATGIVAVVLVALYAQVARTGPFKRGARATGLVLLGVAALLFSQGETGGAMFFATLATLRTPWVAALSTVERLRASIAALIVAVAMFVGVPDGLLTSDTSLALVRFARVVVGVGAVWAAMRAFRAFTDDPTLGIRRVSLRLALSHVLVVTIPLLIVVMLWVSSTYLGVNAERALTAGRLIEREAAVFETSAQATLAAANDPRTAARAMSIVRGVRWPGTRAYVVRNGVVQRAFGEPIPGDPALATWVAGLDTLRGRGVVDLGGTRWLGCAVRLEGTGLVVLSPMQSVLDSTIAPIMGSELVMLRARPLEADLDSLVMVAGEMQEDAGRPDPEVVRGDSVSAARLRAAAEVMGMRDSVVRERRRQVPIAIAAGDDTLSVQLVGYGLTGQVSVMGLRHLEGRWQDDAFALTVRTSLRDILLGLFDKLRDNPWQAIPVAALVALGLLLLPLFATNLRMVRGMGRSITHAIRALREGARAFSEGRLAHRILIEGEDDLWDAAQQFNTMAAGLEQAREAEQQRTRYENELEVARRIQARLLPTSPPSVPGYDLAGRSESAREVGGDYYDHLDLGDGRWLLVIADVSGKGVPASLLMSGFRAALIGMTSGQEAPAMERVAYRLNEFLHQSVEAGRFVTAFLGVLDTTSGRFAYVNAGHNPPLLRRASGRVDTLTEGGLILGILPGSTYDSAETVLEPGDLMLLFTDGVTEGADASGEQWGDDRLVTRLGTVHPLPAREVAERIVREVRTFEGQSGPADDLTVLVVKRL